MEPTADIIPAAARTDFVRRGVLLVIAAPTAAGKTTLCRKLKQTPGLAFSVSCTTRPPRPGEEDGRDYHFLTVQGFRARLEAGDFLETAQVHGNYYGTLKQPVYDSLREGHDILLDVDAAGAAQIRSCGDPELTASLADVFIHPPGLETLRARLRLRGSETEDQIERRLITATRELPTWKDFKYTIVSGAPEEDFARFQAILDAERCLTRRLARTRP